MNLKDPLNSANVNVTEVRHFFYTQAFADGIRITFAILLPALLGSYLGYFDVGLTVALGAMVVSLTDSPGPIIHKRNGLMAAAAATFLVAVLTGLVHANPYLLGAEITLVTFFFSMFVVYGARATSVGNTGILVMILTMDRKMELENVLPHALLILAGAVFYLLFSLALYRLRPYRNGQRALGDCIREIASYLSIKADFYNTSSNLEENYNRMVAQQIVVNEKQDLVRELFFKTRQIVQESTNHGRKLVFTFVETVDLFEDITAAYYDYRSLRNLFGNSGALDIIHESLKKIVVEINAVGVAIQSNASFRKGFDYDEEVKRIKTEIDAITVDGRDSKLVLRKIVVNIRNLLTDLSNIEQYFETGIKRKRSGVDHSHFISHQSLDPKIFWNNLNFESSGFRHAIRVCLASMIGYLITQIFHYGAHSYWILLTIAFMLKPAFSLTKERNIQRIVGTVGGGIIGVALLLLVENKTALFVLMVLCMIGTYSFMRINYLVMVMFTTPYVLILFAFLGTAFKQVAGERLLDTVIGCAIAFPMSYWLFPAWESQQLKINMRGIVKANALYLQKIIQALLGEKISVLEYKVARREVYLNSANLSAAFQRMLSEPKSKQGPRSQMHQFVVLNHILFSNIATIATALLAKEPRVHSAELIQVAKKTYAKLEESFKKFGDEEELPKLRDLPLTEATVSADDELMKEQLNFIYSVSKDIDKITASVV
ncbi:FUSC family membrane protein [Flavisolibacter ginsenosidimutans]|uniref:Uncharacterized protein n=1 Tax=Flavisolibacter ginsenosidimutans TaxID=661481 RepID=A0A5B8UHY9_9BACT|nr:FUSC family membrane protein [Flavisolibacter ginsenosidimutans]QEC55976.1 hypothetical protein FSB75_08735 [Flavisolibacter ginsenosidimutans]